jgi:polyvinyl alcohol dehydrogenase (cytochrome)
MHSVDADTGELIWNTKVEDHPLVSHNRIAGPLSQPAVRSCFIDRRSRWTRAKYECCKFRGSLIALDAHTGKILWKSFTVQEEPKPFKKNSAGTQMYGPAGGAIWSAPTIDPKRKLVYVATGQFIHGFADGTLGRNHGFRSRNRESQMGEPGHAERQLSRRLPATRRR